jgi:hypothetical protein
MTTKSAVQIKEPVVESAYDTAQIRQMPKPDKQDTFVSVEHAREQAYEMIRLYRPALETLAE